jgi:hypothetical protein
MKTYKLIVYVPSQNADTLRHALGQAGGGKIGNYSFCSFTTKGIGRFLPEDGANPHIGEVGKLEQVEEERVEITVEESRVSEVLEAMKNVHPYEEVAYDLYLLSNSDFE